MTADLQQDEQPSDVSQMLRDAAQSQNTRIAYEKGWRCFEQYCDNEGLDPLQASPESLVQFFTKIGTQPSSTSGRLLSIATITIYRAAINRRYAGIGKQSPAASSKVKDVLNALARIRGIAPRRVKALRETDIQAMITKCPQTAIGRRDAAVLALGFAAALRRSEICGLAVADIERVRPDRIIINLRKSKTDQTGRGQSIAVPDGQNIRPIKRLNDWLEISMIRHGSLFQTMRRGGKITGMPLHHSDIPRLVKHYAKSIGLDPKDYSAHSLRAGFVTSAAVHHARLDKIMEVTRHKSAAMVLKYIRDVDAFEDHAGDKFL